MKTAAIMALNVLCMAVSFTLAGWHLGRAMLLRRLRKNGAFDRPPPAVLQEASDTDLFVEFMARAFLAALRQGNEAQAAQIRELAMHVPALQARLAAFSDEPRVTTHQRGQA